MEQTKYIEKTLKLIHCDKQKKDEIRAQLLSDFLIAKEQGESSEDVQKRQGTPAELAKEFNDNLGVDEVRSSKKFWIIAGIAVVVILGIGLLLMMISRKAENPDAGSTQKNQVETFSDEEASTMAKSVRTCFQDGDYTKLIDMSDSVMKAQMTETKWQEAKTSYNLPSGSPKEEKILGVTHTEQNGVKYIVVSLDSVYQQNEVLYTISFTEKKELAGFYLNMKE